MTRFIAIVLLSLVSVSAGARQLVDVRVYDRVLQRELPVYTSGGRCYVAGTPGHEYAIRLRNVSGEDVMAVVSVDGVNVVSGETAAVDQRGYILWPGQRYDINGWRKSLERVAAFYFSQPHDAYATRTGRPDDLGVIGVAVFRRLVERPALEAPADAGQLRKNEPAAPASRSSAQSSADEAKSLGTGHGGSESAPVRYAQFERATTEPEQLLVIEYDSRENLIARGVIPAPRRHPQPFPERFVADPPNG